MLIIKKRNLFALIIIIFLVLSLSGCQTSDQSLSLTDRVKEASESPATSNQKPSLVDKAIEASDSPMVVAQALAETTKTIVDQRLDSLDGSTGKKDTAKKDSNTPKKPDNEKLVKVKVVRVVDGDTIIVKYNKKEERVRLIGVDTPESVGKHKDDPQPYGVEASEFTKKKLEEKEVYLEFDVGERDNYKRLLAYVWIDGEMFNETLLKEGYAQVMTVPPNVKHSDYFLKVQREAKKNNRGLWGLE